MVNLTIWRYDPATDAGAKDSTRLIPANSAKHAVEVRNKQIPRKSHKMPTWHKSAYLATNTHTIDRTRLTIQSHTVRDVV